LALSLEVSTQTPEPLPQIFLGGSQGTGTSLASVPSGGVAVSEVSGGVEVSLPSTFEVSSVEVSVGSGSGRPLSDPPHPLTAMAAAAKPTSIHRVVTMSAPLAGGLRPSESQYRMVRGGRRLAAARYLKIASIEHLPTRTMWAF